MPAAGRLHLRVFLEGVEVPAISARITGSEGAPLACEIAVVPTDPIYDLLPRTSVLVFAYDNDGLGYSYPDEKTAKLITLNGVDLRNYKLAFDGEFVAVTFQKQPGQRNATLVCLSPDNYWDSIRQSYVNFTNGGIELFELAFLGVKPSGAKSFDVAGKDLHSNLYVWLTASKSKATGKPNIYLGAHRVLREMWFAANDWYGAAFNRWRVGDTVVGLVEDETAAKLFQLEYFRKWLTNQIGGKGGQYTLASMMQMLLGTVFHTTVTVPFPRFDPQGRARGYDRSSGAAFLQRMTKRKTWVDATLNSTIIKPDTSFLVPPVCNIIFPHQYMTATYQRAYLQEPTRLFFRTSMLFTGQNDWLTERFYAPDFASLGGLTKGSGAFFERLASTVLPHERYVGLNPAEAWQDDLAAYVAKGPRRQYLAALADYTFWKMRFGPRVMNGTGPLNLNLVPGYPALMMSDAMPGDSLSRHIQGNLQTVVHLIDQSGGFTSWTMTHVRHHTEVVDLDATGALVDKDGDGGSYRSLEAITSRGTDGFLDNRYDVERIGKEVYQELFGCDSLYDLGKDLEAQLQAADGPVVGLPLMTGGAKVWADIDAKKQPMRKAIWALEIAYRQAALAGADLTDFSRQVCWRPKASLPEVMGIPSGADLAEDETSLSAVRLLIEEDFPAEGFLSSAVDPSSYAATTGDTYTGMKRTYEKVTKYVDKPESEEDVYTFTTTVTGGEAIDPGSGLPVSLPPLETGTVEFSDAQSSRPQDSYTETVQHDQKVKASYGLAAAGEARRAVVYTYLDSLRMRGLRG